MSRVADQLSSLWPALAFLLVGVPLATLLDRLGFFDAAATWITSRGRDTPVLALWVLAALTTVVLNLDTTVVLLAPLYLRIAARTRTDPVALVAIPLLLASLASSVLSVSNLTTLIVVDRFDLSVGDVVAHLALPSLAAITVGWFLYRRRHPTRLSSLPSTTVDRSALTVGGLVVVGLLAGFVVGPSYGIAPWMTAAIADGVLIVMTRHVPLRDVPVVIAAGVTALATLAALIVPPDALTGVLAHDQPVDLALIAAAGAVGANVVNNLPALLIALDGTHRMSWGLWAWLLGVNTGAVLLVVGSLANLLWSRIVREEGLHIGLRRYASITMPIALPALVVAAIVLGIERALYR